MTTYKGANVLELEPDRADGTGDTVDRVLEVLDPGTGGRSVVAPEAVGAGVFEFRWANFSRAEALVLRQFIESQAGRAVPFWVPDWTRAFDLTVPHGATATLLVVNERGYANRVWGLGRARRFLAIRPPGGSFEYHEVTAAVDLGNDTEVLTIDPPLAALCNEDTLISFLRYVRMDTDEPSIEWSGGHYAASTIAMRELPQEVPA